MNSESKESLKFIIAYIICVASILAYSKLKCKFMNSKDIMLTKIGMGLDLWSISHLLFNMLVGYYFSGNYLIYAFILGCIWELIEYLYGLMITHHAENNINEFSWLTDIECNFKTDNGVWWYHKWSDIVMNTFGLIIGSYLRIKKFGKN